MFSHNTGNLDRIVRVVVGLALIAGFFLMPESSLRWLFLIGIVPLVTGLIGSCPLYRLFGISTCPVKRH